MPASKSYSASQNPVRHSHHAPTRHRLSSTAFSQSSVASALSSTHSPSPSKPPSSALPFFPSSALPHSDPPTSLRRFSPSPLHNSVPPIKPRPRRALFYLTVLFLFSFLLLTHRLSSYRSSYNYDNVRYGLASEHFLRGLTPDEINAVNKIRHNFQLQQPPNQNIPVSAQSSTIPKDSILTKNVSDPFFTHCVLSTDTKFLHPSLKRGPDKKEIDSRKSAKQPRDIDDVFSVIDAKRYLFDADRTSVKTIDDLAAGLDDDVDNAIKVARNRVEKDVAAPLSNINVPIIYTRTNRRDGFIVVVNMGGVANQTKDGVVKTANVRRIVTISRGFGKPCHVSLTRPSEMVRINVIVPYSNRPHRIAAFLKMLALFFHRSPTNLVRVIVSTSKKELDDVTTVGKRHEELTDDRFSVVTSDGDANGAFSRAVAIREAAKKVAPSEIIFISDADLAIGGNFLQNCRVNVVRGSQVWFPVMFSLFPYGKGLSSKDGVWRRSSYGMTCMYQSDFTAVGGFGPDEETKFMGWGSEDVFLYNRYRDNKSYAVLRSLEPGLQHQWHGKDCEHNEHYEACMRTVYLTIGSQDVIAKLMADKKVDVSSLTKDALPV